MKFKLGDFVRFVEERREGYITRVIDEQMVGVTGDDDFEIPVPANKVTLVHGHSAPSENDAIIAASPSNHAFIETGIFLAVISDTRIASVAHFHLVNTTSYQLLASIASEKNGFEKGEFAGLINPGTTAGVYTASLNELSAWPKIIIRLLCHSPTNHTPKEPIVVTEKFNAKDFSAAKKNAPILNQASWLFRLDPEEIKIDAQELRESFFKPTEQKTGIPRPSNEIDLHIEELTPDHQFLTSTEMLSIQLKEFRKNLDAAIVHKLSSIIFIHGTGNGTLKREIHKVVGKHPNVKTFMDARKEKFGYGATEVWLK